MTDTPYYLTAPGASLIMAERLAIKDAAQEMAQEFGPTCLMVNIGVAQGGTLWCLRAGAPEAEIIGIDINPDSHPGPWTFYHADSRRVHADIPDPIHLLLIDGDHDYYGIRADIENWTPKVVAGALVLFHDYGNETVIADDGNPMLWTAGVKRAVDEMMTGDGWELVTEAGSVRVFKRT